MIPINFQPHRRNVLILRHAARDLPPSRVNAVDVLGDWDALNESLPRKCYLSIYDYLDFGSLINAA